MWILVEYQLQSFSPWLASILLDAAGRWCCSGSGPYCFIPSTNHYSTKPTVNLIFFCCCPLYWHHMPMAAKTVSTSQFSVSTPQSPSCHFKTTHRNFEIIIFVKISSATFSFCFEMSCLFLKTFVFDSKWHGVASKPHCSVSQNGVWYPIATDLLTTHTSFSCLFTKSIIHYWRIYGPLPTITLLSLLPLVLLQWLTTMIMPWVILF